MCPQLTQQSPLQVHSKYIYTLPQMPPSQTQQAHGGRVPKVITMCAQRKALGTLEKNVLSSITKNPQMCAGQTPAVAHEDNLLDI